MGVIDDIKRVSDYDSITSEQMLMFEKLGVLFIDCGPVYEMTRGYGSAKVRSIKRGVKHIRNR